MWNTAVRFLFKHVISIELKHLCCGSEVTYREDSEEKKHKAVANGCVGRNFVRLKNKLLALGIGRTGSHLVHLLAQLIIQITL